MKVFGKQGSNYMVIIPKEELLQIVFGETSPAYNDKIKQEVYSFIEKIDREEVEIFANKIFVNTIRLANTTVDKSYNGISANIDAINGLITPIEKFITSLKAQLDKNA